ncbi:MAG: BON domain-containing protein [Desulfurivibrionaceae bacterium]|jgi:osmotically-inducible protein OsmY
MKLSKNLFANFCLAILLVSFLGCAATTKQESSGEYIDDSVITTKVKAEIFNDNSLKSSEINVETFKGVVQLSGFVSSQADINKAIEVTRRVKGVNSVKNDMRVKGKQ